LELAGAEGAGVDDVLAGADVEEELDSVFEVLPSDFEPLSDFAVSLFVSDFGSPVLTELPPFA
jgi:hypothetical protein